MGKYLDIAKRIPRTVKEKRNPQDEAAEAVRLLQERGWVAIRSHALGGEVIIWRRDGAVAVPARWQGVVSYTLEELRALVAEPPNPEELRQVHDAKKVFGGRIEGMSDG